jgi:hypothetical protein
MDRLRVATVRLEAPEAADAPWTGGVGTGGAGTGGAGTGAAGTVGEATVAEGS